MSPLDCPPWCQLPADHDSGPDSCDPIDGARYIRHRTQLGLITVEQLVVIDQLVDVFAVVVLLDDVPRALTAAEAARLAVDLQQAAVIAREQGLTPLHALLTA